MTNALAARLAAAWSKAAGDVSIIDGEKTWSGTALQDHAELLGASLKAEGLGVGEPVIVQVSNRAADFAAFLAVWRSGGVVVPVHRTSPAAARDQIVRACGSRFVVDGLTGDVTLLAPLAPSADPILTDAAVIVFTSGSTGAPKGVVLSHAALATKLDNNAQALDFPEGARTLLVLQITFSFGLWVSLLTLTTGGTLVLKQKFEVADVLSSLVQHGITHTALVPTMLRAIVAASPDGKVAALLTDIGKLGLLRHLYTGGEILSGTLGRAVIESFVPATLFNIFGLTETATSDFFLAGDDILRHPGAIGRPGPGVSFRIVNGDNHPLAAGEVGELQIRTGTIMNGYLGQPDVTAAAFADGFFRTGDLARIDHDHMVAVVGRAKEIISRGGNKVYPQEVEQALQSHPAVALALATGVADPLMGERIHAAVQLREGTVTTAKALRAWAAERLDKFKLPDAIHFVADLPTGRTGKADRGQLRQLLTGGRAVQVTERSGGEILVDNLLVQGADTVFCVPGESFLGFLAAAHGRQDRLRIVTCRQEGGAAYMAEADGKLTGQPGLCFVTRGPGACNAAVGVHTAFQDSTPMVLLVGQVNSHLCGRETFQEVEFRQMFAPLAKHVEEIADAARIPEVITRAFALAQSGRPGPVVLSVPQDILEQRASVADGGVAPIADAHPAPARIDQLRLLLAAAERPLAIVGGSGWTEQAGRRFAAFAEAWDLPVAASFRRQDLIDNRSRCYVGELGTSLDPALGRRVRDADLLLVVGARLGEMDTQAYTLVEAPLPRQTLIHVLPSAEEFGRVYTPTLAITAAIEPFVEAVAALSPPKTPRWADWTQAVRLESAANRLPGPGPGNLNLGQVVAHLADLLPDDAIICYGAGNYTGWVQRYYRFRQPRTQLSPINGSMGYGLPAAIAACLRHPDRPVVAFAGDGCFMMTVQELATAAQQGVAPVVLVVNNGMYGTIRAHQERNYPGRTIGTDLLNPDFVQLAKAFGAWSAKVERTEDFASAFEQARASGRLAVLELVVAPEALSTRSTSAGSL
jgi:acetolactate synthase-1/2/3 large subunit